ncbi:MAG: hypothetical protein ACK4S2_15315 [Gemmobacter sp.]|uniref:hypothetical protein n=1 Tax=Gemmobacter sp. TaxID=1898957 RepID=UPI00391BBB57
MNRADRAWLAVLALAWALFVAPATRLLFNPQSVQIDGEVVRVVRSFPGDALGLPRPVMSYSETVHPLTAGHNGGHFCQASSPRPVQYVSRNPVGQWSIPWARACLSDPAGFVWEARWQAYVGLLPLGPVRLSATVSREVSK